MVHSRVKAADELAVVAYLGEAVQKGLLTHPLVEAGIGDGDCHLLGDGRQEAQVRFTKGPGGGVRNRDHAQHLTTPRQRYRQRRADHAIQGVQVEPAGILRHVVHEGRLPGELLESPDLPGHDTGPVASLGTQVDLLVVAIDMTLAPEAPYPACVQEASYGIRWLKAKAIEWKGDASTLGVLGSSSGGHVAELLGMRPNDPRYNAHILAGAPGINTRVAYVATRSPISDPFARFKQAEKMKRDHMIKNSTTFFNPWETVHEANPQEMLDRGEKVELPPLLIMQGALDDNVIPPIQEKFSASYRAAGGECQLEIFPECTHEWVAQPGPHTDRAHQMLKAFIARQLKAGRKAV